VIEIEIDVRIDPGGISLARSHCGHVIHLVWPRGSGRCHFGTELCTVEVEEGTHQHQRVEEEEVLECPSRR
jgi:hypothetical protein